MLWGFTCSHGRDREVRQENGGEGGRHLWHWLLRRGTAWAPYPMK
jgi:hypothetical protein